jgi:hypothetical protein
MQPFPTDKGGRRSLLLGGWICLLAFLGCFLVSCESSDREPRSRAYVATHRDQLVGGPRALGELGDVVMENDLVRIVVQAPGYSRGFGVYGGSIIDAALVDANDVGNQQTGRGQDAFGEFFPAFFLQAMAVDQVTVVSDGTDGGPAVVVASGSAGDFLELVGVLNRAAIGSHTDYLDGDSEQNVRYEQRYELHPGEQWVRVSFSLTNTGERDLAFPGTDAQTLLGLLGLDLEGFTVPIGDVALYGALANVFLPGEGFDVRFGLERSYDRGIEWPAFPGIVVDWVASRGNGVSYGLLAEESDDNYVWSKRELFEAPDVPVNRGSMLVPFIASGFLGVFHGQAPAVLPAGESFSVRRYFIVGDGDVGSIVDQVLRIRDVPRGSISGQVIDDLSGQPVTDISVLISQIVEGFDPRPYAQYTTRALGSFGGDLPPGRYQAAVVGNGRPADEPVAFEIVAAERTHLLLGAPASGGLSVRVLESASGAPLPAKVTAVGFVPTERAGQDPATFLYNLRLGEPFLTSDMVPDDPEQPETLRYIESVAFTDTEGIARLTLRPGRYEIWSSRGPEYDAFRESVVVTPGQNLSLTHTISRVVDTTGWIAGDTHMHTVNSIDSALPMNTRVRSAAAEGLEWIVATDHNFVTNYEQALRETGLVDWLLTTVGLELTTLESGHFNAYPLEYRLDEVARGAFEWARRTPDDLFADVRSRGADGYEPIVQVNHPRDQIIGYFDQYRRDAFTMDYLPLGFLDTFLSPSGPAFVDEEGNSQFSFDFDALEILNGKLYWEIHHHRIPLETPEELLPPRSEPGGILIDDEQQPEFPGAVDDWFNLLNLGYRPTGLGTSDSHGLDEEVGYFRSMIRVADDRTRGFSLDELLGSIRSAQVLSTNGPMVDFTVEGAFPGQTVVTEDGTVEVSIRVQAPPWMGLERLVVFSNAAIAHVEEIDPARNLAADPLVLNLTLSLPVLTEEATSVRERFGDAWFVVEVSGTQSLFPIVRPLELPPLLLTDAVGSLAGPLGLDTDSDSALAPPPAFPITPIAVTNPVFVVASDGGAPPEFRPPGGPPPRDRISAEYDPGFRYGFSADNPPTLPMGKTLARWTGQTARLQASPWSVFSGSVSNPRDIRLYLTPCPE